MSDYRDALDGADESIIIRWRCSDNYGFSALERDE